MACATTISEYDISAKKPLKSAARITNYKSVAPVDKSDLELHIPSDSEMHIDLKIHYRCGEAVGAGLVRDGRGRQNLLG
jgi:hypothetical protein